MRTQGQNTARRPFAAAIAPRADATAHGAAAPSPFAPDRQWAAWREARRPALPRWHIDRDWLTGHALDQLPRVCAQMGTGRLVAFLPRPLWWPHPMGVEPLTEAQRRCHMTWHDPHDGPAAVAAMLAAPGADRLLYIDRHTGEWDEPHAGRRGADLVDLAAARWGLSGFKAAWRLARTLGLWGVVA